MSSLKKIRGGHKEIFSDEISLTQNGWATLLDLAPQSLGLAVSRGGATDNPINLPDGSRIHQIPVSEFPKIMKGIQETPPIGNRHYYPWSLGIDTTALEFKVTTPSGTTLIYTRAK